MYVGAHAVQKRARDPLELELQLAVSYPMRVLGTKLRSLLKAACTLKP